MPIFDPLDVLNRYGVRVVWVHQLPAKEILYLEEQHLALADATWDREDVSRMLLGLVS